MLDPLNIHMRVGTALPNYKQKIKSRWIPGLHVKLKLMKALEDNMKEQLGVGRGDTKSTNRE